MLQEKTHAINKRDKKKGCHKQGRRILGREGEKDARIESEKERKKDGRGKKEG